MPRNVGQPRADGSRVEVRRAERRIEIGVAGLRVPLCGEVAAHLGLEALHALLAGEDIEQGVGGIRLAGVQLVGLEEGCAQRQAGMREVPFGADFVGAILFGRKAAVLALSDRDSAEGLNELPADA